MNEKFAAVSQTYADDAKNTQNEAEKTRDELEEKVKALAEFVIVYLNPPIESTRVCADPGTF